MAGHSPDESRTAALGRKRKPPGDLFQPTAKNQRFAQNEDFVALVVDSEDEHDVDSDGNRDDDDKHVTFARRESNDSAISKESGEVSSSNDAESRRESRHQGNAAPRPVATPHNIASHHFSTVSRRSAERSRLGYLDEPNDSDVEETDEYGNVVQRSPYSETGSGSGTALKQLQRDLPTASHKKPQKRLMRKQPAYKAGPVSSEDVAEHSMQRPRRSCTLTRQGTEFEPVTVNKDVTPSGDDAAAPWKGRAMTISDIDNPQLRTHVQKVMLQRGSNVKAVLQDLADRKQGFGKAAKKALRRYEKLQKLKGSYAGIVRATSLTNGELGELIGVPDNFRKDLSIDDVPANRGFRQSVVAQKDKFETIAQAVFEIVRRGGGGQTPKEARKMLEAYFNLQYVGGASARKSAGTSSSGGAAGGATSTAGSGVPKDAKPARRLPDRFDWPALSHILYKQESFTRPMELADIPGNLHRHIEGLSKLSKHREHSIADLVIMTAGDETCSTLAKKFAETWTKENYVDHAQGEGEAEKHNIDKQDLQMPGDADMGDASDAQSASMDEESDEDSEHDETGRSSNNYGALVPSAAFTPAKVPPATTRLSDLKPEDQMLQNRYFRLSDPRSLVRCLSCGAEGHMAEVCPSQTCKHCGSDEHFASACPAWRKCGRCRRRGHDSGACREQSKARLEDQLCDVCGQSGHVEEECAGLWCTFTAQAEQITKIRAKQMLVECYNCGAGGHWGDDCPRLPDFIRGAPQTGLTWSAKNAERFIERGRSCAGNYLGNPRSDWDGCAEGGGGNMQAYQLVQLADY